MNYCVYILSNTHNTVVYIGVARDLVRRVYEHRHHLYKGSFTDAYNVEKLVYFEYTGDVEAAIAREKQRKAWTRKKKDQSIESKNPNWIDLYDSIL